MIKNIWSYTCNQKTFYNKIEAIKESVDHNQPIYFNSPESYNHYPWTTEPIDSWESILKERALEIRNSSNYINLLFGGGCDSKKMLDTFVKNNIFIDEITCLRYGFTKGDYEVNTFAIPYLEKIKNQIPRTKISIQTATIDDYKNFYNSPDWIKKYCYPSHQRFRLTHESFNRVYKASKQNNSTVLIGRDKPTLIYRNNKWYFYFLDVDIELNQPAIEAGCVFFYADSPKVHAKQCHMLMNYFKSNFDTDQFTTPSEVKKVGESHINFGCGRIASVEESFPDKARGNFNILDNGNQILVQNKKDLYAVKELLKDENNKHLVYTWQKGLKNIDEKYRTKWFNEGNPLYSTIGVYSKFYGLTQPEVLTIDELAPNGLY